jgi:hypothetical protein
MTHWIYDERDKHIDNIYIVSIYFPNSDFLGFDGDKANLFKSQIDTYKHKKPR